jgi:DNA processing protein
MTVPDAAPVSATTSAAPLLSPAGAPEPSTPPAEPHASSASAGAANSGELLISAAGRSALAWSLIDGIGPLRYSRLIEQFGNDERALAASAGELRGIKGIGPETSDRITAQRETVWKLVEAELEAAVQHGVRIIARLDPDYPPGLRRIPDAPIVLYVRGELRPTDAVALAVVGSRRCSLYGSEQAQRFGELLAAAGFTVVSGLAHGIDALAHHGAVQAGGRSLAVLGNGLHEIYPPENRALAEKLVEQGALLSELPMRTQVQPGNFPSRNRIIAGLALGTLVVEAANRSGALITARLAAEYNREVFAIPGRIQDAMSIGTNQLIRDGAAKLVLTLEDILCELGEVGAALRPATPRPAEPANAEAAQPDGSRHVPRRKSRPDESPARAAESPPALFEAAPPAAAPAPPLSDVERRVWEAVPCEPILQDAVIRASGLPAGAVLAAFTSLELKGLLKRLPGQMVMRPGGTVR